MAQIEFVQIDIGTLDEEQRVAWEFYLQAKAAFKQTLQSLAPAGRRVQFYEKYGTVLKIAITEGAAPGMRVSDFVAMQRNGARA
jgi:hypothetical protein